MKKGFIIAAIILSAAGLSLIFGALIASGFDFSKFNISKFETNTYTPSGAFDNIEINSPVSDVTFLPSTDGKTSVVCTEREKAKHLVVVEDMTLKIVETDERAWFERFFSFGKKLSVTIYLPEESYDKLTVKGSTGDVTVPDFMKIRDAGITLSTGDVVFRAKVGDHLTVKTSTGEIRLEDIEARTIELSASTGDIEMRNVRCDNQISVNVSTGSVKTSDVSCESFVSTGSTGDVTLKNTLVSDGIDIERSTGDVRFDHSDAGHIRVKTSTGDITGSLLTDKVFLTKSSTGRINVPDSVTGGRCELTTSTGNIRITLDET